MNGSFQLTINHLRKRKDQLYIMFEKFISVMYIILQGTLAWIRRAHVSPHVTGLRHPAPSHQCTGRSPDPGPGHYIRQLYQPLLCFHPETTEYNYNQLINVNQISLESLKDWKIMKEKVPDKILTSLLKGLSQLFLMPSLLILLHSDTFLRQY